jgi:hypothetical protein
VWPVSDTFLKATRSGVAVVPRATFTNPFTSQSTDLPIESGSNVTVDVTAAARRVLSLVCPPLQSLYDTLNVPGGEITVTQTFRFIDGTTETVPLGVFCVDQSQMGYRTDGQLQVTAPDRWWRIVQNRFGLSRSSVPGNGAWQEIQRLVEGAWPNAGFPFPGWAAGSPGHTAITLVGPIVWSDGRRDNAITSLLVANSLDFYFDATGAAVLQPLPVLTGASTPVWTVDASNTGVFMDGTRKLDLSRAANAVIVSTSATDIVLPPVEVKNVHDPSVDPLSTLGPLGYVPRYYTSAAIRTSAQQDAAGLTILEKQLQAATQVSLTAVPNPALDGWDVIDVVYPPGDFGTVRPSERQLLESTVIPLTPDTPQTIALRSTRPTPDDTT